MSRDPVFHVTHSQCLKKSLKRNKKNRLELGFEPETADTVAKYVDFHATGEFKILVLFGYITHIFFLPRFSGFCDFILKC
jgi:hypothetical protein